MENQQPRNVNPPPVVRAMTGASPFFLSAAFFLSFFFSFFAPLPLMVYASRAKFNRVFVAGLCNVLLIWLLPFVLSGTPLKDTLSGAGVFAVWIVMPGIMLPWVLLKKRRSPEFVVGFTSAMVVLVSAIGVAFVAAINGMGMIDFVRDQISQGVDLAIKMNEKPESSLAIPREAMKQNYLRFLFPSAVVSALMLVWVNFVLLVQFNPAITFSNPKLAPSELKKWKSPEWLAWPTLGFAAIFVLTEGTLSDIGLNFLMIAMAVYFIQGLAIVTFALDAWKIYGLIRTLFLLFLLFALPMVIGLGFFDLWFDFRSKLRQTQ